MTNLSTTATKSLLRLQSRRNLKVFSIIFIKKDEQEFQTVHSRMKVKTGGGGWFTKENTTRTKKESEQAKGRVKDDAGIFFFLWAEQIKQM